jgi:hypothetical protein
LLGLKVLIHGFPQDWFEYHAIMPQLAKRFTAAYDNARISSYKPPTGGADGTRTRDLCSDSGTQILIDQLEQAWELKNCRWDYRNQGKAKMKLSAAQIAAYWLQWKETFCRLAQPGATYKDLSGKRQRCE